MLIAALGAEEFADRESATKELAALGRRVEPDLRKAAGTSASGEIRSRAGDLLARLPLLAPDELRVVRAVEVVEWVATPEAVRLLESWVAGTDVPRLATEARSARARLMSK